MLRSVDRLEEARDLFRAENYRQPEGLLGHRDVIDGPRLSQPHLVQEAQRRDGDADAAGGKLAVLHKMHLIFANLLRPQRIWGPSKVSGEERNLLEIGLLCVLGKVANANVFEHPLA